MLTENSLRFQRVRCFSERGELICAHDLAHALAEKGEAHELRRDGETFVILIDDNEQIARRQNVQQLIQGERFVVGGVAAVGNREGEKLFRVERDPAVTRRHEGEDVAERMRDPGFEVGEDAVRVVVVRVQVLRANGEDRSYDRRCGSEKCLTHDGSP